MIAQRWFRCTICYITFKTRFIFKGHMKSGIHLPPTGPEGVDGIFGREFMLLLDEDIFYADMEFVTDARTLSV